MIIVNVRNCNKNYIIFVVETHTKFIKNSDDIQFNEIFTFDNLFNNLFYQKQRISILLYHDIEVSIIDVKSQVFVNFYCE